MRGILAAALLAVVAASPVLAEPIRVATFNASLSRSGPGLLYKDLGKDPLPEQIAAVIGIIAAANPDILLLNEFDYDGGGAALKRFRERLADRGLDYPYFFAAPSNTGEPSGIDLDGDGEATGPADAFGYGRFPGAYGMALLSRHPLDSEDSRSFRLLKWVDLPGALLPLDDAGAPFPSAQAHKIMRLSSKAHWDIAIDTGQGRLHLLASHPTPPVFDGPEDTNGRRNHDEIAFWRLYLDGVAFPDDAGETRGLADGPVVVLGDLNADPVDGDGIHAGIGGLLSHPRLQDPRPSSAGGAEAAEVQAGRNRDQRGDPALDTADWNDRGPGNLRVDYVLPSVELRVLDAGVFWPVPGEAGFEYIGTGGTGASDHRLVWVDFELR